VEKVAFRKKAGLLGEKKGKGVGQTIKAGYREKGQRIRKVHTKNRKGTSDYEEGKRGSYD